MNKRLKKRIKILVVMSIILLGLGGNIVQNTVFADSTTSTDSEMKIENELPVFYDLDEALESGCSEFRLMEKAKTPTTTSDWKLQSTTNVSNMYNFGKHPQAKNDYYYTSAYYFSFNDKVTYSPNISITGYKGHVSVSVSKSVPSGGYAVNTGSQTKKSIPISRGELYKQKWSVKTYSVVGNLISTETKYTCYSKNVQGYFKFI